MFVYCNVCVILHQAQAPQIVINVLSVSESPGSQRNKNKRCDGTKQGNTYTVERISKTVLFIVCTVTIAILMQCVSQHFVSNVSGGNYVTKSGSDQKQPDTKQCTKNQDNQKHPSELSDKTKQLNQKKQRRNQNEEPCLPSTDNNAYEKFKRRHILNTEMSCLDQNRWTEYLTNNGLLGRTPVQSFFKKKDEEAVRAICNGEGRVYKNNLYISDKEFEVCHVTTDQNGTVHVELKTQCVIVACNRIGDECVPVHYEKYNNQIPSDKVCGGKKAGQN